MDNSLYIHGIDGMKIFLRKWDKVENPLGLVQIFHGMGEHSGRYDDFAKYLNSKGFIVYASDHRGHGFSTSQNKVLGYLGDGGFDNIVEDNKIILDMIKKDHKGLPVYIVAHSFGSFLGQKFIVSYSEEIAGIVFSGSAKQDGIDVKAASLLAGLQNSLMDNRKPANLLDKLSFGAYNNKIDKPRTKFDWLSRDEAQVDKYIDDDLSGYISPINFYYSFFKGLGGLYDSDRLKKISKDLPILLLSGDMDPVGKYGESVKRLYKQYEDLGLKDISLKLYEGGRHESINETNKDEVYEFVHEWIKAR